MKQFTLYEGGAVVQQEQVFNDNAACPPGWTDTTGQTTRTLEQVKTIKSAAVAAHAKALRDRVVGAYSAGELASWSIKLAEASKYALTGQASDAPMLSAEAQARGIELLALVQKVGGNATTFAGLEAAIAGADGKHRDAIKALSTFDEVAAYDYLTGWPEV